MKILLDENITEAAHYFGHLGVLSKIPGRAITAEQVADADILLVRSVTQVNEQLLADGRVRFVGSCTSGIDHVDEAYLAEHGVVLAHAPGANALSVVEYVVSALAVLAKKGSEIGPGTTVGIIGLGNVGGRLYRVLERMGFRCRGYDPLLADDGIYRRTGSLEEILQSEVVTLHTPLTRDGSHPTRHMIGGRELALLPPGGILLNTCRGGVIDEQALLLALQRRDDLAVVLDVWEGEPAIQRRLMDAVDLATPHIAGYSYEGKLRGSEMVCHQLCAYLGKKPPPSLLPTAESRELVSWQETAGVILDRYDVSRDDRVMRAKMGDEDGAGAAFDAMRRHYPLRRELGLDQ